MDNEGLRRARTWLVRYLVLCVVAGGIGSAYLFWAGDAIGSAGDAAGELPPGKVMLDSAGRFRVVNLTTGEITQMSAEAYKKDARSGEAGYRPATPRELAESAARERLATGRSAARAVVLAVLCSLPVGYLLVVVVLVGRGGFDGELFGRGLQKLLTGASEILVWPAVVLFQPTRAQRGPGPSQPAPPSGRAPSHPPGPAAQQAPPAPAPAPVTFGSLPAGPPPTCYFCTGNPAVASYHNRPICPECMESLRPPG